MWYARCRIWHTLYLFVCFGYLLNGSACTAYFNSLPSFFSVSIGRFDIFLIDAIQIVRWNFSRINLLARSRGSALDSHFRSVFINKSIRINIAYDGACDGWQR